MDLATIKALGKPGPLVVSQATTKWAPVAHSRELDRILAIPRREIQTHLFEDVRAAVTKAQGRLRLRDLQCAALIEAHTAGGLFAPIAVGAGKSLVCALLPGVLASERAVILAPAGLVKQGERMLDEYRRHFEIADGIRYLSYAALSSQSKASELADYAPDLIIADECHRLANPSAVRTRRFLRYMKAHTDTRFCALSGTITKRSIRDFAHLLALALGDWTPLPRDWPTLAEWSEALDGEADRRPVGALVRLCSTPTEDPRVGWRRRLLDTRGVVASDENEIGASLVIRSVPRPSSKKIDAALAHLASAWERPDGEYLTTALEVARTRRQLRCGGYYHWVWSEDTSLADQITWRSERSRYLADLREYLARCARPGMDSPGLVERAIVAVWSTTSRESFDRIRASYLACQRAIEGIDPPTAEWTWIDDVVVSAVEMRTRGSSPIVIWTDTVPVGVAISKAIGAPYYGAGLRDSSAILDEDGSRTIVCSIQAHGEGRNLQAFDRALVVGGGPTGKVWEQLLGRHHRSGQTSDEVIFDVIFPDELDAAKRDAEYIEQTTGNRQKLLSATYVDAGKGD